MESFIIGLLLFTGLRLCQAHGVPQFANITICYRTTCVQEAIATTAAEDCVLLTTTSNNIASDGYLSLYFGSVISLFYNIPQFCFKTLLFERPYDMTYTAAVEFLLQQLPIRSVYFTLEHGISSYGIRQFEELKRARGIGPTVLYHLNHEQPWQVGDKTALDFTYDNLQQLRSAYSVHPLVLRNYFYEPIQDAAVYVPVGAPRYGFVLGNQTTISSIKLATAELTSASASLKIPPPSSSPRLTPTESDDPFLKAAVSNTIPPSKRPVFCEFRGRTDYDIIAPRRDIEVARIFPVDKVSQVHADHVRERLMLVKLAEQGRLGGVDAAKRCRVIVKNYGDEQREADGMYVSYMESMADAAFALCPTGNNPETFRQYEALELGTIPILIRPPQDKNYMQYGPWRTYPGPILDDWTQLQQYMDRMSTRKANALQKKLIKWYAGFKSETKRMLSDKLRATFDRVEADRRGAARRSHGEMNSADGESSTITSSSSSTSAASHRSTFGFSKSRRSENVDCGVDAAADDDATYAVCWGERDRENGVNSRGDFGDSCEMCDGWSNADINTDGDLDTEIDADKNLEIERHAETASDSGVRVGDVSAASSQQQSVTLKMFQEQSEKIAELEKRGEEQTALIDLLMKRIQRLKQRLAEGNNACGEP